jgi:beta-fructofuranosidase
MATLIKRPGAKFRIAAFDVSQPDGTTRRLKKSTKLVRALLGGLAALLTAAGYAQAADLSADERQQALAALKAAVPRAEQDPTRPVFHYRPPARWMNDVCGAIFHNGYHHVFYQNNPYHDDQYGWGWGHARSKDLVHWEELPFALVPMKHLGERRCNSGCVTRDGDGRPMIFYTWVPEQEGMKRTQWAAIPLDDDLVNWRRVGDGPVMEAGKNGVPADVPGGWSDPYVFKEKGRTFVTFKACGGLVCEAHDKTLTDWKHIGRLDGIEGECPNVFKLQDQWVILRSTYPLSCVTGELTLDGNNIQFKANGPARVADYGYGMNQPTDRIQRAVVRGLYGTNTYTDDQGRRILFGWISGFKTGRGWNGCMSLPRILTLDGNGRLIQSPAPELKKLRREHTHVTDLAIRNELKVVNAAAGSQLEIIAEFVPGDAACFGLKLRSSPDGSRGVTLSCANATLNVAGTDVPLEPGDAQKTLKLHIFLDRSVMEVFVNGGRSAVTRVEYPDDKDLGIAVFAKEGQATLTSLHVWQMKSAW